MSASGSVGVAPENRLNLWVPIDPTQRNSEPSPRGALGVRGVPFEFHVVFIGRAVSIIGSWNCVTFAGSCLLGVVPPYEDVCNLLAVSRPSVYFCLSILREWNR